MSFRPRSSFTSSYTSRTTGSHDTQRKWKSLDRAQNLGVGTATFLSQPQKTDRKLSTTIFNRAKQKVARDFYNGRRSEGLFFASSFISFESEVRKGI